VRPGHTRRSTALVPSLRHATLSSVEFRFHPQCVTKKPVVVVRLSPRERAAEILRAARELLDLTIAHHRQRRCTARSRPSACASSQPLEVPFPSVLLEQVVVDGIGRRQARLRRGRRARTVGLFSSPLSISISSPNAQGSSSPPTWR
jgi:hypothetical protein